MISFLLVFLLIAGIVPAGMSTAAYASILPMRRGIGGGTGGDIGFPLDGAVTAEELAAEDQEEVVDTEGLTPPVTEGNGLESDETQAEQAAKLGLPVDQPSRVSPSGKEIDKKANPLGSDLVVTNRIYQMAYSTIYNESVYSKPAKPGEKINLSDNVIGSSPVKNQDFDFNRVLAAADVNGDGKQELVTAGTIFDQGKPDLKLFVADYSDLEEYETKLYGATIKHKRPKSSDMYTVSQSEGYPGGVGYANTSFKMTAVDFDGDGKDEIAIAAGKKVWICRADMTSFQVLSSKEYGGEIMDIEGKDADGDGIGELLVAKKAEGNIARVPQLLIFESADLASPAHTIPLIFTQTSTFTWTDNLNQAMPMNDVSVDVGDIFGDGIKRIVIAYTNGPIKMAASISFDPTTESFIASEKIYGLVTTSDDIYAFYKVQTIPDVKCVALTAPVPGEPISLVLGGVIFKYNKSTDVFDRKPVDVWTEDSDNVNLNSQTTCRGNITNVNATNDSDKAWIIDTIVGNFDGNKEGKEQILMLHYNKWYSKEIVHITQCYYTDPTDDKIEGQIKADLTEKWRSGKSDDPYNFAKICPVDVKNTGIALKFDSTRSKFMFSNPIVSAVLAVSPFYEELADISGGLDQASTVYGTGTERTDTTSNGVSANVGVTFGFEQGFSVLGVQILQIEFEAQVTNSFSYNWSSGKSIEKTSSFTNLFSEHAVVVTVVPQDLYYYTAYFYDEKGNYQEEDVVVQIPYAPMTTVKPLSKYNQAAAQIPNAPIIGPEVLAGLDANGNPKSVTIGDPRTYPRTAKGLSNVSGQDTIYVGKTEDSSFDLCGTGDSAGEQSLTSTSFSEKEFEYKLSYQANYNVAVFGVSMGITYGGEYTRATAQTDSEFTTRMGTVSSVPEQYNQYEFQWALAVYKYDLKAGDTTQQCEVINYVVKPVGEYPPKMPKNFVLDSRGMDSNILKWDAADGAAGYTLYKSEAEEGPYTSLKSLTGKNTVTFTDIEAGMDKTYYYTIVANSTKNTREAGPVKAEGISITGIVVKTQPKLVYNEDEGLDLSALEITLTTSKGTTLDMGYGNFGSDITTSLADGVALTTEYSGKPVTLSYGTGGLTANTRNLTINARSPYDFTISVIFKIGTQEVTSLQASKTLQAVTELTNTSESAQDVLVIMALYSDKGNMEMSDYVTVEVASAGKETVTPSLALPGNVSGYSVKVFVWDGTSYTATTLSPKSQTLRIPVQ